ncbi:hypothetical protein [Streptomyces sp. NPDC059909]
MPQCVPLSCDLAVEEVYEPWRAWLVAQLAHLPEKAPNQPGSRT